MKKKKVFVSGCFDVLHSGHVSFFKSAAKYGDLYVSIGSDKTINELKNRNSIYAEEERLFIISELKCVTKAFVAKGSGKLDFVRELKKIKPDIFVVNEDGDNKEKRELCKSLGIKYKVLKRSVPKGMLPRTSTSLRVNFRMPYRIDLAGGWLDQPYVNKHHPGPVLTISVEPTQEFNLRSGMATSTRNKAIEIWGDKIPPVGEKYAKILFNCENPPGVEEISGSQDSIGIVMPGLNYLYYDKGYWPSKITNINNEEILDWLESVIYLVPLKPRGKGYKVLEKSTITKEGVKKLSFASQRCFDAIINKDVDELGKYFTESFLAQIKIFPRMINRDIFREIEKYKNVTKGYKLSGAGGGGYLILISETPIQGGISIKIRR